jgi:hypothetical protein
VRTAIVSDLHLGGRTGADVLQVAAARDRLAAALEGADRLVLLGDAVELRHGPAREALDRALPVLGQLAEALGPDAEVVVVPGNHEHALAAQWLDDPRGPLGLESRARPGTAGPLAARLAKALGTSRTSFAYPGVWLREDVFALHGHHGDVHGTVPTFERLAAGAMQRLGDRLPDGPVAIEDYERILAPLYAWMHSAAQRATPATMAAGAGGSAKGYALLTGDGHHPVHLRVLARAFPLGVRGLQALGLGELSSDLSGPALRRNGLRGTSEVLRRLGVRPAHVVFGHTHRTGPLERDSLHEWRSGPTHLHNCGSWVYETHFMTGSDRESPYWPGGMVEVVDDGPPRLRRLLGDLTVEELRAR